ncbi:MAG: hypothetical protein SVN78_10540 [Deferribacterota bacterium]|nr:hypothetical protein [Deferribacterota bacterium]
MPAFSRERMSPSRAEAGPVSKRAGPSSVSITKTPIEPSCPKNSVSSVWISIVSPFFNVIYNKLL